MSLNQQRSLVCLSLTMAVSVLNIAHPHRLHNARKCWKEEKEVFIKWWHDILVSASAMYVYQFGLVLNFLYCRCQELIQVRLSFWKSTFIWAATFTAWFETTFWFSHLNIVIIIDKTDYVILFKFELLHWIGHRKGWIYFTDSWGHNSPFSFFKSVKSIAWGDSKCLPWVWEALMSHNKGVSVLKLLLTAKNLQHCII